MEIINQFLNLDFIWNMLSAGFFLGGLVGAIVGTSIWTVFQRGSTSLWPILIGGSLGLVFGIIWEGQGFSGAFGADIDAILGQGSSIRTSVVGTVVVILAYVFGFMAIGAFIHNYRRAIGGFVLGGLFGTLAGIMFILIADLVSFPVQSALTPVFVGTLTALLMAFLALGDSGENSVGRRARTRRR